jgi:hypothetical protein
MDQTTFNRLSVIAQYASVAVSIGVGLVVWWYTRVTQGIRLQGQRQLELLQAQLHQGERQLETLQMQVQLGLAPYLIARVTAYSRGGQTVSGTQTADSRASKTCNVWNPTNRPAHQVCALVYTGGGNYFWSEEECDVLVDSDVADGAGQGLTPAKFQRKMMYYTQFRGNIGRMGTGTPTSCATPLMGSWLSSSETSTGTYTSPYGKSISPDTVKKP